MIKGRLVKKFEQFINSLSLNDRVAVLHHTDPDGVCSAVIMAKLVERIRKKGIELRLNQGHNEHSFTMKTARMLKKKKINKVIITDITVDEDCRAFARAAPDFEIAVLDHHKLYNDLNSDSVVFIKPQLLFKGVDSAQYCASKLCFDLAAGMVDVSDLDWIAAVGIIGDCNYLRWHNFLKKVFKKYRLRQNKDWFKTALGKIASIVSDIESFDLSKVKLSFEAIYNAGSYKDVLKSPIAKVQATVEKELNYWLTQLDKKAEFHGRLIFYEVTPRYSIKSPLSTIISLKRPHNTIIVADTGRNPISVSARRRDYRVEANTLLEKAVKGMQSAAAGGHIPSSGATVSRKDYPLFKKRVIAMAGRF